MIPVSLQLKNFLSYGALQTISFDPYHLIALSGKNGHGKSALLDALTWAVWGQARKISGAIKADAHLLRLGQTTMMVSLDIVCNGQRYRIRREFAQAYGKPYAALDIGLIDEQTQKYITLSDKTIRDTQLKINTIIGLDYESFINSAFLRQGQANEFSKKSPKERKDVLATILNLDHYELLRKRATEKVRQASITHEQIIKIQERIEQELQNKAQLEQEKNNLLQQLQTILDHEEVLQKSLQQLNHTKQHLHTQQRDYHILLFQFEQLQQEQTQQQTKLRTVVQEWRSTHHLQLHAPSLNNLEEEINNLYQKMINHQLQAQNKVELKEKLLQEQQNLQNIKQQLYDEYQKRVQAQQIQLQNMQGDMQHKQLQLYQLINQTKNISTQSEQTEQELQQLSLTNQKLSSFEKTLTIIEKQFEKRKQHYHTWLAQAQALQQEHTSIWQKTRLVQDDQHSSCPLCEQNLSASRRKFLRTKFLKQDNFYLHRLNRYHAILKQLKLVLTEQKILVDQHKKEYEQLRSSIFRYQELTETQHKLKLSFTMLEVEKDKLQEEYNHLEEQVNQQKKLVQELLDSQQTNYLHNIIYIQQSTIIKEVDEQLSNHSYHTQQHQNDIDRLQKLEQQKALLNEVNQIKILQAQRQGDIKELTISLKALKQLIADLTSNLQQYDNLSLQAQEVVIKEQQLTQEQTQIQQQKEKILQEKGRLEMSEQKLKQFAQEQEQYYQQRKELQQTIFDYQTIATALSKDGIQALLIEDAIPEIEQEANKLLATLTDNQAHIFIESLRDLKKGGTKETLDIKISDPAGIRPYELFSGGEAFRIDFALRIAISKLLARRAGTALQTLIIDEGFGSQDEEGLYHMMDCLYKIQDHFSKIIIVSHLPALKDQFPVHFNIEKGPFGSIIKVIEQG